MRYWLSVDWDFFCPDPPDAPAPEESPKATATTWKGRDRSFSPKTMDNDFFVTRLGIAGISIRGAELRVSDSHRFAYQTFRPYSGPATILHFDAHHDLGYPETFWEMVRDRKVDCGNWLWAVLDEDPLVKAQVVFPGWKGALDLLQTPPEKMSWMQLMKRRVRFHTWPVTPVPGKVEVIHLARSGCWSAPWHDDAWLTLVSHFERVCNTRARPHREGCDVLRPRNLSKSRATRIE